MGFVLDSIQKEIILQGPQTVNTAFVTDSIRIDGIEDDFSVSFIYDGGVSVDMTISLEVSVDGINFAQITDSDQQISDATGVHIWDVASSGTTDLRVAIQVDTGSIDIQEIRFSGKRRH